MLLELFLRFGEWMTDSRDKHRQSAHITGALYIILATQWIDAAAGPADVAVTSPGLQSP